MEHFAYQPERCYFNPRTPRGVRPPTPGALPHSGHFNPRTPRGVRPTSAWPLTGPSIFQSTHPARGATRGRRGGQAGGTISIHAPREGCDWSSAIGTITPSRFQSTHPARGATGRCRSSDLPVVISIHAPREGCDSKLYQRAESLLGSIRLFAQGEEG